MEYRTIRESDRFQTPYQNIFLFDPTDENAIHLKCNVLVKNGKVGLAKSTYDAFCSEYEQLLGTPYNKSFNDICH